MFKRYASGMIAVAAAALFAVSGCTGNQQSGEAQSQTPTSATDLVSAAAFGLDVDYNQLASPADAMSQSELVVRGTVAGITEGITFSGPNAAQAGRSAPYVTLAIDVESTLNGPALAGGTVFAQLNTSSAANPPELARAGTGLPVVAVLDDISGWSPARGVTVVRPDGVPANGPLYFTFPDGLWLQGSGDATMVGVHAHPAELPAAWGSPQTLAQYWATLGAAEE
jgi:hypothetical protein